MFNLHPKIGFGEIGFGETGFGKIGGNQVKLPLRSVS
jgi:hypothetical protein